MTIYSERNSIAMMKLSSEAMLNRLYDAGKGERRVCTEDCLKECYLDD
jgi:hypothetical protein